MKFGDIIGGINTAMGIGGALFGNNRAFGQQKDLMALQMGNQQLLNAQAQQYSKDLWDYTNFANQRKHLEKAGLSVGLMYGMSGGGGATTSGQSGGSASGGNAPLPMDIASAMNQIALTKAQIDNIEADTALKNSQAGKTGAETDTINASRDYMVGLLKEQGKSQWFDNLLKEAMREGVSSENTVDVLKHKLYGTAKKYDEHSPEFVKFNQDLLESVASTKNLDASKALTDEKTQGYWIELLIAKQNADSNKVEALAKKLSAEHATGEFTNWKTWVDLGMQALETVGSLAKIPNIKGIGKNVSQGKNYTTKPK